MYELLVTGKWVGATGSTFYTQLRDKQQRLYEVIGKRFYSSVEIDGIARFAAEVKGVIRKEGNEIARLNYIRNVEFVEAPSDDPEDIRKGELIGANIRMIIDYDVCIELAEMGHQLITQVPSEIHKGRNVYVFARTTELDISLLAYDPTTYYA